MINITTKMNLSFPDFGEVQKELEKIASKVIIPDIQGRMESGVSISGAAHKPNSTKTKINRFLHGFSTTPPLMASRQLYSSFRISLLGDKAVQIMPRGTRQPYPTMTSKMRVRKQSKVGHSSVQKHLGKIHKAQNTPTNYELADILQNQGVHGHRYEFFGISDQAEGLAMKHMFEYIKKEIIRGRRKLVQ